MVNKKERIALKSIIRRKRAGMRAFVARPNRGVGADRSVIIVGSQTSGWFQAIKCWHHDHADRARKLAAEYNAAPNVLGRSDGDV